MTLSAIIGQFPYSRLLLPPSSLCSGKSQFQSSQSQPPRLNERNGRILGYYIRYGQLGSETLSKKTIRDTENLQVGNSINCHLFLIPCTVISGLALFSKESSVLFSCSDSSDNNIWTGPVLKILGHSLSVHLSGSRTKLQQKCGGNIGRR